MDILQYHKSVANELDAVKQRIRNLMNRPHYLTDGEVKESILRNILRRHLPEQFTIGRGFIFTPTKCSSQIDILVYDSSYPTVFREHELVFVTPDAVRAIIEVKTSTTRHIISEAFDKLIENAELVANFYGQFGHPQARRYTLFVGLFSYDTEVRDNQIILDLLYEKAGGDNRKVVNHVCLNDSLFFKFWDAGIWSPHDEWHSYDLERLAPAYFINNVVNEVAPISVYSNAKTWFPLHSKEVHRSSVKRLRE